MKLIKLIAIFVGLSAVYGAQSPSKHPHTELNDSYKLFEQRGRMVPLPKGNRISLYCTGAGKPTVVLETGFGGGAYVAWHKLQPRLAQYSRVCSYDRAGYGFSELGNDLPRDIHHDVDDLYNLLKASGEPGPYILVGHSDGGHIIGAFTDSYPREVTALIFLDAAVLIDKQQLEGPPEKLPEEQLHYYDQQLEKIKHCLTRAQASNGIMQAKPGDYCLDSNELSKLSAGMAYAVSKISARPDYWKAYLSEAEQHYLVDDPSWEASLLPHHWEQIPIRVFTASVASLDDAKSAAAYGLQTNDHKSIEASRQGRKRWESLQARICELSPDCRTYLIPTAEHEVQNVVPDQVALSIRHILLRKRR
jgi:pimeloyl-ACP methyl ester carboxylesterase